MRDRVICATLEPFSWIYSIGWLTYKSIYDLGLKKPNQPFTPIICVGNLVVGGSGKTPLILYLAQQLQCTGKQVVISSSGYGSPASIGAQVAPEGQISAKQWGDEPAMIRWVLSDVPIIVGQQRVEAAQLCAKYFPGSILLMDDGFQHLPLKKNLNIVLDPQEPLNSKCLPAGPYREPRQKGRQRADLILDNDDFKLNRLEPWLKTSDLEIIPSGTLKETCVNVLCALGNPKSFLNALEAQKIQIEKTKIFPDHDPLDQVDLLQNLPKDQTLIVTAKDWVKLREHPNIKQFTKVIIAGYNVTINPEEAFLDWMRSQLKIYESKGY